MYTDQSEFPSQNVKFSVSAASNHGIEEGPIDSGKSLIKLSPECAMKQSTQNRSSTAISEENDVFVNDSQRSNLRSLVEFIILTH
ncbi:hypothetical protein HDU84_008556 [Entophlyctis sp. JEL0112]|nr:hypothetical protein HDU84_008556 [Entophlyctis sp. JEL0112]